MAKLDSGSADGPTVRRMLLGTQLRRLREAQGISRDEAGQVIRATASKISRMELGKVSFKLRDVTDLLTFYGVLDGHRDELMQLAQQANTAGWWHTYGDLLPAWFHTYLGLEAAAALIRAYEVQFIPGLLQTADYARAVVSLHHGHPDPVEIDRRVQLRMARQRHLLTLPKPPRLWAIVDEAALRRQIGGPAVMRAQIAYLIDAAEQPHHRLQVIGFDAGGHAGASGAFTILRFDDPDLPDIVYIEQLTSALYLDKRDDLDHYAEVMERLATQAAPPNHTPKILRAILQQT
jgi:transcriptional regulator with XRE-family HTH domain